MKSPVSSYSRVLNRGGLCSHFLQYLNRYAKALTVRYFGDVASSSFVSIDDEFKSLFKGLIQTNDLPVNSDVETRVINLKRFLSSMNS